MGYEFLKVEREGPIVHITINRPEVMNALHRQAHFELHHAFDDFAQDPEQWVAIVTGAGKRAFCAGYDLKSLADGGKEEWASSGFGGVARRYDCNKPIIAAVNGVALGGGFEIALACDIIIAAQEASFALPEPRVGLAAVSGGLHRLPRQIGLKQAMGLILTGRRASTAECFAMGLINEIVPASELRAASTRWAQEICKCSPMAVRAAKEAVLLGLSYTVDEAIDSQAEFPAIKDMYAGSDFVEGPRAFAEKRAPRWQRHTG